MEPKTQKQSINEDNLPLESRNSGIMDKMDSGQLSITIQSEQKNSLNQRFNKFLNAKNIVMEHSFSFTLTESIEALRSCDDVRQTQLYAEILEKIKEFLAQAIGNIISATEEFALKNDLEEAEAKNFGAKNIFLNICSIYNQTIKALKLNIPGFTNVLQEDLILEVDNIVHNILLNIADGYPQAPISGGTTRMKRAIKTINSVYDPQKDFLEINTLQLYDQYKQTKFFESCVLKIFNKIVSIPQDYSDDPFERTIFERFKEFNENLFLLIEEKEYSQIIKKIENNEEETSVICYKFYELLREKKQQKYNSKKIEQIFENIGKERGKSIKFSLGQKIPSYVKEFSQEQIKNRFFKVKHSSHLRLLTKWAEQLQFILKNPEEYIQKRSEYQFFETSLKKLVPLTFEDKKSLVKNLQVEYSRFCLENQKFLKLNYGRVVQFINSDSKPKEVSNIHHFTSVRISCSKTNASLAQIIFTKILFLIAHLVKAGHIDEETHVNLVTFRIGDLLRSKLQCSQNGFINVLKTMYLLDSSKVMKKKFRLVRIKNKLDQPANNIIINYLFMNKIQCELQLSIQEDNHKAKNTRLMSHFVYELTRGAFGPISECAIMVSQLDPLIKACSLDSYSEKIQCIKPNVSTVSAQSYLLGIKSFICQNCKILKFQPRSHLDSPLFLKKYASECYNCRFYDKTEQKLKPDKQTILQRFKKFKIVHYGELKNKDGYCMELIDSEDLHRFFIIFYDKENGRTASLELSQEKKIPVFDKKIDHRSHFIDITDRVNRQQPTEFLTCLSTDPQEPKIKARHQKLILWWKLREQYIEKQKKK